MYKYGGGACEKVKLTRLDSNWTAVSLYTHELIPTNLNAQCVSNVIQLWSPSTLL